MKNKEYKFTVSMSSVKHNEWHARMEFAVELNRMATLLQEGDTLGESGTMDHADYGAWKFIDPDEQ